MTTPSDDLPGNRDPDTGLLSRTAFLREVRNFQNEAQTSRAKACLLVFQIPVFESINQQFGVDTGRSVLRDILGLIETRLRGRDTFGRLTPQSLCVLLRQCSIKDAEKTSAQFGEVLANFSVRHEGVTIPVPVQRRVIPLGSLEALANRSRELTTNSQQNAAGGQLQTVSPGAENIASISAVRPGAQPDSPPATYSQFGIGAVDDEKVALGSNHWRAEPGRRLIDTDKPIIYRLRSLQAASRHRDREGLRQAIDTLARVQQMQAQSPVPLLIVDIALRSLDADTVSWLLAACKQHQVLTSSLCIALSHAGWAGRLRHVIPALKQLDRAGVLVMLDAFETDRHGEIVERTVNIDFRQLSGADLNAALGNTASFRELQARIGKYRQSDSNVICRAVDTDKHLPELRRLGVDIVFGRFVGRSVPLSSLCGSSSQ
ncbi:MAG: diguanylate cyclase [Granulosicoccus sp.]